MRQSRMAYYADFVIYPMLIGAMILIIANDLDLEHGALALGVALVGASLWTLLEYLLHRFLLHGSNRFATFHEEHHSHPRAWIGTPSWLSVTVLAAVALPTIYFGAPVFIGLSLAVGLMAGFLFYGLTHHAIHHARTRQLPHALATKAKWHFEHHRRGGTGNFGVSTQFWDRVFQTKLSLKAPRSPEVERSRLSRHDCE